MLGQMSAPNTKLMIPDRAIASFTFSLLSLLTFRVYATIMWGTTAKSDDAKAAIGSILDSLETTRRVLAVVAVLWCAWSWRKEWWLPSVIATCFAALALYISFFIDS
jgi:hypothetical protein